MIIGILITIGLLVLSFKFVGWCFGLFGKVLGAVFSVIGYILLGALSVVGFGLAFFVLPIIMIVGVAAIIRSAVVL